MERRKRSFYFRYITVAVAFAAIMIVYFARAVSLQLLSFEEYDYESAETYTRYEEIKPQRGEIYDRNGKKLVSNEYYYDLLLDYGDMPWDSKGFNDVIYNILLAAERTGSEESLTETHYPVVFSEGKVYYSEELISSSAEIKKLEELLRHFGLIEENSKDTYTSVLASKLDEHLLIYYGIVDKETEEYNYPLEYARKILERRYELDYIGFSPYNSYLFAEDISLSFVAAAEEPGLRGIATEKFWRRVYLYPGYASHLLGYVGKITESTKDYYLDLGYPLDATVGLTGAEYVFETVLAGKSGTVKIVEDEDGNIISRTVVEEPVAGYDIKLTIDIDLQIAAEEGLKKNIEEIVLAAEKTEAKLDGEDADSGACVAMDPKTGEVLALASYPTYDLSTFFEDIAELLADSRAPLTNRALSGLYPPGSTFKIGTAIAALSEKVVDKNTVIHDSGVYRYYTDYQPRCWINLMYGYWHGDQTVTDAIRNSCNYYFFECGRLLTIEKLNKYHSSLGLGRKTGIEYPEKEGALAGPEYTATHGLGSWSPGDTLQAAIGQSYNTFTPLQLSVYMSTIVNYGTRYSARLLYSINNVEGAEEKKTEPTVESKIELSEDVINTVKTAMENVYENGSTAKIFADFPVSIGGKSGTAQISKNSSDNGIFIAFAPVEDPQIVVSAVIEHGNSGTNVGSTAKAIFSEYFGIDENNQFIDKD